MLPSNISYFCWTHHYLQCHFFLRLMYFLDSITYSSSFRTWNPRRSSCPHMTLHVENLKISYWIHRNITRIVVSKHLYPEKNEKYLRFTDHMVFIINTYGVVVEGDMHLTNVTWEFNLPAHQEAMATFARFISPSSRCLW